MGGLQYRAEALLRASISENTSLTYNTSIRSYDNFRAKYKIPCSWPTTAQHVIMFISFCFEEGLLPSTIATYIAGINYFHKLRNWEDFGQNFLIKKVLEGCRRLRNHGKDQRAPITFNMLINICQALRLVCCNGYEAKLFQSAFTLAFFGLFRISELLGKSQDSRLKALQRDDIIFLNDSKVIQVTLRVYKTNQLGVPTLLKLPCENNNLVCPVCTMLNYLQLRPNVKGPLFIHLNGSLVTRYQFAAILAKCIQVCNGSSRNYKSHSFRIGRATQLVASGVSGADVMKLGRWRSDAYLKYIR